MPKVARTPNNPYGLSTKQQLVIADAITQISKGEALNLVNSTLKYYSVKSTTNARNISNQNLARDNFRKALVSGLQDIGLEGKMHQKLQEGLEATKITSYGKVPDYLTRLGYLRELHKIFGLYAPDRIETKSFNVSTELTPEELDLRIKELQVELSE
ncbi:hypothetical protein OAL67_00385 [bacterium]|nr:hypothetical protein [bacterium]